MPQRHFQQDQNTADNRGNKIKEFYNSSVSAGFTRIWSDIEVQRIVCLVL